MSVLHLIKNLLKIRTLIFSLIVSFFFLCLFYFLYLNSSNRPLTEKFHHYFGMATIVILGILFFSITYLSFVKSNYFKFISIHFKEDKSRFLTYLILLLTLFFTLASVLSYLIVSLVVEKQVNWNILILVTFLFCKLLLVNLICVILILCLPTFWTIISLVFYAFFEDSLFLSLQNTKFSIIAKLLPFQNFNEIIYGNASVYYYLYFLFLFFILHRLILNKNLVKI